MARTAGRCSGPQRASRAIDAAHEMFAAQRRLRRSCVDWTAPSATTVRAATDDGCAWAPAATTLSSRLQLSVPHAYDHAICHVPPSAALVARRQPVPSVVGVASGPAACCTHQGPTQRAPPPASVSNTQDDVCVARRRLRRFCGDWSTSIP